MNHKGRFKMRGFETCKSLIVVAALSVAHFQSAFGEVRACPKDFQYQKTQTYEGCVKGGWPKPDGSNIDGLFISYNKDGSKASEENYKNGKLEGVKKTFNDKGTLVEEVEYRRGKKNGVAKIFHPNGKLAYEVMNVNGRYQGGYTNYDSEGKVQSKGQFKSGDPDGVITTYFPNGSVKYKVEFKNGRPKRVLDGEAAYKAEQAKAESVLKSKASNNPAPSSKK